MPSMTPTEQPETTLTDKLFVLLQNIIPHHLLSRMMHWLARVEWAPIAQSLIKGVVHLYKIVL